MRCVWAFIVNDHKHDLLIWQKHQTQDAKQYSRQAFYKKEPTPRSHTLHTIHVPNNCPCKDTSKCSCKCGWTKEDRYLHDDISSDHGKMLWWLTLPAISLRWYQKLKSNGTAGATPASKQPSKKRAICKTAMLCHIHVCLCIIFMHTC